MILGICGRATHAWLAQGKIPDQAGHRGLRRARTVEIRLRDASAHQMCLCKQTSDGVTPEEDPTSLKKAKLELATSEGLDIGPSVRQGCGNRPLCMSTDLPAGVSIKWFYRLSEQGTTSLVAWRISCRIARGPVRGLRVDPLNNGQQRHVMKVEGPEGIV